ncbi:MAG: DUF5127 domain-containing protein, partial [Tannerella sp.]|nr:DUF5127 domain-containing protein [Tannerella sp.]
MKREISMLFAGALSVLTPSCLPDDCGTVMESDLRAPAVPLVTIDPYTSAWSTTDCLYDSSVKHWTGKDFPLLGVIRVDDTDYRFMGEQTPLFDRTARQLSVDVQATQTHYTFDCGPVQLKLTFTAPLLTDDLKRFSRPVNYLTYSVSSTDERMHEVQFRFEVSDRWALNTPDQPSVSEVSEQGGLIFLKTGSTAQDILAKKGDDLRIDWGYFYLAAERENTEYGKLILIRKLGMTKRASGKIMLGYDDLYSIQYFGENLRPYWNADGKSSIVEQFQAAHRDYKKLNQACSDFDLQLRKDA